MTSNPPFIPRVSGRRFLHSPGPTPLPDAVLHAMAQQPMDLADPRVDECITACEEGLQRLMSTTADVFLYASNGHGVWEAVVENVADVGASVLVPGTGVFSEGWAVQTEALGRRVVRTPAREGWPLDAAAVEQVLRDDHGHHIQAVFAVHTDTSTSVTSDLAAVRRAIDAAGHPALLVADVVASLGAAPFAMDALGVDVALGASQKGLMCPPGAGFVAVNKRAFARAEANPAPRFYWDWVHRRHNASYRKYCGTPPLNMLFGMQAAVGTRAVGMVEAARVGTQVTAGVRQADLQARQLVEHAVEYQVTHSRRRVERVADEVVEIVGGEALGVSETHGMQEHHRVGLLHAPVQRVELLVRQLLTQDVGAELDALEAILDAALQLFL